MGKKSVKEDKNMYQMAREFLGFSRDDAEERTNGKLTSSRVEKIENGSLARPEEVVWMAEAYDEPKLCNYYCTSECAIGKIHVPKVENVHDLPQITMELLSNLNALNRDKERIIDIAADGEITEDEKIDFNLFRKHLDDMSLAIETLKLWAEKKKNL